MAVLTTPSSVEELQRKFEEGQARVRSLLETHAALLRQREEQNLLLQSLHETIQANVTTLGKRKAGDSEVPVWRTSSGTGEGMAHPPPSVAELTAKLDVICDHLESLVGPEAQALNPEAHAEKLTVVRDLSKQLA